MEASRPQFGICQSSENSSPTWNLHSWGSVESCVHPTFAKGLGISRWVQTTSNQWQRNEDALERETSLHIFKQLILHLGFFLFERSAPTYNPSQKETAPKTILVFSLLFGGTCIWMHSTFPDQGVELPHSLPRYQILEPWCDTRRGRRDRTCLPEEELSYWVRVRAICSTSLVLSPSLARMSLTSWVALYWEHVQMVGQRGDRRVKSLCHLISAHYKFVHVLTICFWRQFEFRALGWQNNNNKKRMHVTSLPHKELFHDSLTTHAWFFS